MKIEMSKEEIVKLLKEHNLLPDIDLTLTIADDNHTKQQTLNGVEPHQKLYENQMGWIIDSEKWEIRREVALCPNLTQEQITKLVNDKNWNVRYDIAKHPNLTKTHLDKLIKDCEYMVRHKARCHPLLQKTNTVQPNL